MKEARMRRRIVLLMISAAMLAVLSPQSGALAGLPDALVMRAGDTASVEVSLPVSAEVSQESSEVQADVNRRQINLSAGEETGTAQVVLRLLGLVPVKTVTVTVQQPKVLVPGGRSLGVAVEADGLVVVGSSDLGRDTSPAWRAGVRAGDVIQTVNGARITSSEEIGELVEGAETVHLGILRNDEKLELEVRPQTDPRDGRRKLGVWVRESTAGVGTLTYYDPETGDYGALGHGIADVDTGTLFPVGEGAVYENAVVGVTRGREGIPGELTGEFFEEASRLGEIERNTEAGVFGTGDNTLADGSLYPEGLPVALRSEVHEGGAQLLSTVEGEQIRAYDCEIEKVGNINASGTRSMVIRITDEALLDKTGGIVQGMSGSPIVQNGKLVGAVTHVLVNDPTRGYGIFIENMLDAAG